MTLPEPTPDRRRRRRPGADRGPDTQPDHRRPSTEPSTTTRSREDRELPESTETERSAWPWFLSGLLGVGFITALAFSLRRR